MYQPLLILAVSSAAVAVLHALVGVDHTLPFVLVGRARGWSLGQLLVVTAVSGVAHVGVSIGIALVGGLVGVGLDELVAFDLARGRLGAMLLVAFGCGYALWGISHRRAHAGRAAPEAVAADKTAWWLFIAALLGPCEILVPLIMAPMIARDVLAVAVVASAFAAATIATMVAVVGLLYRGAPRFDWLSRFGHEAAGLAVAVTGLIMLELG